MCGFSFIHLFLLLRALLDINSGVSVIQDDPVHNDYAVHQSAVRVVRWLF